MNLPIILFNYYKKSLVSIINLLKITKSIPMITDNEQLKKIIEFSSKKTDISDHLTTLYIEAMSTPGKLIVELGTRGGDSTYALEKVAARKNGSLVSVDLEDCPNSSAFKNWTFVKGDDIAFAKEFPAWLEKHKLPGKIDFLFIDTSHEYEHTKQEIEAWLPFLNSPGKVAFHDTNMKNIYRRKDGSVGPGWNNNRGVIKAIEEYLGVSLNEDHNFKTIIKQWIVNHWSTCSGLTILEKIS